MICALYIRLPRIAVKVDRSFEGRGLAPFLRCAFWIPNAHTSILHPKSRSERLEPGG